MYTLVFAKFELEHDVKGLAQFTSGLLAAQISTCDRLGINNGRHSGF